MNNMQAIDILKAYKERLENSCSNQLDDDIKAFNLAIKALKLYPVMLQPTQRVSGKDYKMINAMRVMKTICKGMIECSICPMYDNCKSTEETMRVPCFWYIPEV